MKSTRTGSISTRRQRAKAEAVRDGGRRRPRRRRRANASAPTGPRLDDEPTGGVGGRGRQRRARRSRRSRGARARELLTSGELGSDARPLADALIDQADRQALSHVPMATDQEPTARRQARELRVALEGLRSALALRGPGRRASCRSAAGRRRRRRRRGRPPTRRRRAAVLDEVTRAAAAAGALPRARRVALAALLDATLDVAGPRRVHTTGRAAAASPAPIAAAISRRGSDSMSGLFGSLHDGGARRSTAQRVGLDVAGQNIANLNTPGYARRTRDAAPKS